MLTARIALIVAIVAAALGAAALVRVIQPAHEAYAPGLGEFMAATQMRHAKLGIAGANGNWDLADYELDELEEGLSDAVTFHPTHKDMKQPLAVLVPAFTKAAIDSLRSAVKAKDAARFDAAFTELTGGCNGCHQAAAFQFNVVTQPSAPPVTNQQFTP